MFSGVTLTLPKYKIVDCGAFCEVIFFYISPKNLLGDFFYSLNDGHKRRAAFARPFDGLVRDYILWLMAKNHNYLC